MQKVKYSKYNNKSSEKQQKKAIPNMPNVDKSEHLNKPLTSKLIHIVASTLQIFKRIYTVSK